MAAPHEHLEDSCALRHTCPLDEIALPYLLILSSLVRVEPALLSKCRLLLSKGTISGAT